MLAGLVDRAGEFVRPRELAEGQFARKDDRGPGLVYQYACGLRKRLKNNGVGELLESDRRWGYRVAPWAAGKIRRRSKQAE